MLLRTTLVLSLLSSFVVSQSQAQAQSQTPTTSSATEVEQLQQKLEQQIAANSDFVTYAKRWHNLIKEVYGEYEITAEEMAYATSNYFAVINTDYLLTPTSYSSKSVTQFLDLQQTCASYIEVAKEQVQAKLKQDCSYIQAVFAGAAFNKDIVQTLGAEALKENFLELQAPTAQDLNNLQILFDLPNLKLDFPLRYVSYQDYKMFNLIEYFKQTYNITLVEEFNRQ
ncbi:hypothetical protein CKF54_05135 [Psittacicella hinzii]|uniref:Uncharacterized protein n=1 Tax=Psittacicella hinzii TaxID=2028575 RepID=A0A3A1Y854_9GAMM|nr:hypothetical protein [Psittacicella hinzii]RIY32294.1 hypothetical protein CKF54_05135 [Psittacicella hinzii]